MNPPRRILAGRFVGAFGVRGEVKLDSFTEPKKAILGYQPWLLRDAQGRERELAEARGRETAKGVVVSMAGIGDRDAAEALRDTEVWVARDALPPPQAGEYYWVDLEGLRVINLEGVDFGVVSHLFSTGANDVVVVHGERERLIPFVMPEYITTIDFNTRTISVDWDADF